MATPTSRTELKDYCLRRLGFPVIDINVDDDQLDDRIDDALAKFRDFHYDGTEELFLAQQVTSAMMQNGYFTVPDSIVGVARILPIVSSTTSSTAAQGFNIFDINYQLRLNDFYNLTSSSYTYYVIAREHLAMLDMIITGELPFAFNKKVGQVRIYTSWDGKLNPGDYVCMQATRVVDPELYSKVFNDTWLKDYTTALFKMQWGSNLTKYTNYTLPGGLTVNGEKILADAMIEIAALEEKLRDTYEAPPAMFVG